MDTQKLTKDGENGVPKQPLEKPRTQETLSPPSSISSPTHEFSFTISLHPCPPSSPTPIKPSPSFEIDLAPADDIFYHGHLLPLHLLSHPAFSPRSSDISIEDLHPPNNPNSEKKPAKPRLISLWRRATEDVTKIVKKCKSILFRSGKDRRDLRRRPYSFSGNLNGREGWKKKRGEFSAPASMRTSPTNSGLLFASPVAAGMSSSGESSMEELQSAIQAAIAHCKNSTSVVKDDKSV